MGAGSCPRGFGLLQGQSEFGESAAKCNGDGGCHALTGQLSQLLCHLVRFPILDVQAHGSNYLPYESAALRPRHARRNLKRLVDEPESGRGFTRHGDTRRSRPDVCTVAFAAWLISWHRRRLDPSFAHAATQSLAARLCGALHALLPFGCARLSPKLARDLDRVDAGLLPPLALVTPRGESRRNGHG